MQITLDIGDKKYSADLSKPLRISIPFVTGNSPRAFYAPPYESSPFSDGDFIGSLDEGSPVNFFDIKLNPHGNGTHTESVLHIDKRGKTIGDTLEQQHFVALLCTVTPKELKEDETIIDENCFDLKGQDFSKIDALIIRTAPNFSIKKNLDYSGTNPCYFSLSAIEYINGLGISHLLTDLPSLDREVDGGKLSGHKSFWNVEDSIDLKKTISEMIFVDNSIADGLYLLNLQTIPLDIDASPSNPVIFELKEL